MQSAFKRLAKIFQSETHAAIDKIEDPVKLTEQGIRDLKSQLNESIKAYADVKTSYARMEKLINNSARSISVNEDNVMKIIKRQKAGEIDQQTADNQALRYLRMAEEEKLNYKSLLDDKEKQKKLVDKLKSKIMMMKNSIQKYENQLVTLKCRSATANSIRKINDTFSTTGQTSTVEMLERMKGKVMEDEIIADTYEDFNYDSDFIDDGGMLEKLNKLKDEIS